MSYCIKCGQDLPDGARFCPFCGRKVSFVDQLVQRKGTLGDDKSLGILIHKFGTLKKLYVFESGVEIKGIGPSYSLYWEDVAKVEYSWSRTTINVFAHEHELRLKFCLIDGTVVLETWNPGAIYFDFQSKKIKKLLYLIQSLGIPVIRAGE